MGDGVDCSWENSSTANKDSTQTLLKQLESNKGGAASPDATVNSGKLAYFADTAQSPDCCPSTYTGSDGCVCLSTEQAEYLNMRGGNRTQPGEF